MLRRSIYFHTIFRSVNIRRANLHTLSLQAPITLKPNVLPVILRRFSSGSPTDDCAEEFKEKFRPVEEVFQRKTQLEHILLRPDTYIGSVQFSDRSPMWTYDTKEKRLVKRPISYVPGLYKIFDEILVNAADNRQRDRRMNTIRVDIDQRNNRISVMNNGKGIPVVWHTTEQMYVPELIFGTLLTSSNYDDSERKVTGGRNGFGAKLCNIFSKKFTLETSYIENGKRFKQTWENNMTKTAPPEIGAAASEDFTRVTFEPDLSKFGMTSLDDEVVGLIARRVLDIAATTRGVKVYLNDDLMPCQSFPDYVKLHFEDQPDLKVVFDQTRRWQVAVAVSDHGFQQVSFVNSVWTVRGGTHVDCVVDQVTSSLLTILKPRLDRKGIPMKLHQIKNNMFVFVNALIENPAFDSQTKETLTTKPKLFGSEWRPDKEFLKELTNSGLVEAASAYARQKQEQKREKSNVYVRTAQIEVPKLEDANEAGTSKSRQCTLILTEGDSAKSMAMSGLSVLGRDRYGVFPLKGKLLNVREGPYKQVMNNVEVNALLKILGLEYKRTYETEQERNLLRYGKIMIMTDQDQDGSHIKGLVVNFIHHNWPHLLRHNFLEQFITPIVKARLGRNELRFFSIPEYLEWRECTPNWPAYKIKYYKGLGTSTAEEAKQYFSDLDRHRIFFRYGGPDDDEALDLAFSPRRAGDRKAWITEWTGRQERYQAEGKNGDFLYDKETKEVTFSEFVHKELVVFSNADNVRNIPNLVDGLKPGQRKVLFTCFKRNDNREIKVSQLAGSVGEMAAYHHGEKTLMETIVAMAHDFVGSNNLNLLLPLGQFGTRLHGGKDSASPRYLFTQLNPAARALFPPIDDHFLTHLHDLDQPVEPVWYCPLVPLVLLNGVDGMGTGWCSRIPNYRAEDLVQNVRRLIQGQPPLPMTPHFSKFGGTIFKLNDRRYITYGEVSKLNNSAVEITELPVRTWTLAYKEQVLEEMLKANLIESFKEYHTEGSVRFVIRMNTQKLYRAQKVGLHKVFRLRSMMSLNSMVLFDARGRIRFYDTPEQILTEFFEVRRDLYKKREGYLLQLLKAQLDKGVHQLRFIRMRLENKLDIDQKSKAEIVGLLRKNGFVADPVKHFKRVWKKSADGKVEESEEDETSKTNDFDYILGMNFWKVSKEELAHLEEDVREKRAQFEELKKQTWRQMWEHDLNEFEKALKKQEKEQKMLEKGRVPTSEKVEPSKSGRRIQPNYDDIMPYSKSARTEIDIVEDEIGSENGEVEEVGTA